MKAQRIIEVGIMSAPEISFEILRNGGGVRKASFSDGKILYEGTLHDELTFEAEASETLFSAPSFILYGVTIGVDFHWQRKQDQTFAGTLKFIVEEERITAVNVIGVEDYLVSVISSEMKASASLALLKAHAVISRSWVISQVEKRRRAAEGHEDKGMMPAAIFPSSGKDGMMTVIRWWDHDDHKNFDVCADDHCQRYQGLTNALGENVRKAVAETWGQVLRYEGELCDARFSKCCGGMMERFSTCWEDKDYPYLQPLPDTPDEDGRCFCDTDDESVLSQVLNDYDMETKDFFRWETRYTRSEVSELVRRRSGIDFGEIRSLEPLERGESGRISKLRIVGSANSAVIGKELMIRRILSESHLKSSAFDVEWQGEILTLRGRGWGHGVGLCQIGAAMMARQGFDYIQILKHYYPGAEAEQ